VKSTDYEAHFVIPFIPLHLTVHLLVGSFAM